MEPQTDGQAPEDIDTDIEGQEPEGVDTATAEGQNIADLPEWAQVQIRKLRTESANYRTKAKSYDDVLASQRTDQEKAIDEAKAAGIAEATAGFAHRLAGSEIRAALSGLVDNPQEIVDDLNLGKYVTEDGEVDTEAVAALKARYEGLVGIRRRRSASSIGAGRSGGGSGDARAEALSAAFG